VLSLAVRAGSMALVQRLLTLPHVDANAADLRGRTALMLLALKSGDATTCAALLRSGAQAAQLAHGGVGALLLACQEGHAAMAELLLDGGADVNSRTSDEHALTPLVMAVLRRRTACVALLLRRGADLNVVWQRGMSVLGVAVRLGCADSVRQLLAAKASADGSGIGEDAVVSPLVAASGCGNRELVDALLEAGADVDNTALHNAARGGFVGVVRTLLAFGAAVDWASPCAHPRVHTPLHYAVSGGHADVVAVLLAHGADRRLIDIDDSVSASVRAALATTVPHPRGGWLVEEVRGRLPHEQEKEKTEDDRRRREHDKNARETVLSQLRAELARIVFEQPKTPRDPVARVPVAASSATPHSVPLSQQWPAALRSLRFSEPPPSPPRQPLPAALSSSDQSMLSKSADSDDDDHDQASGIGYDAEDCDTTSSDSSATSKGPWSKLFGHAHTHLIETH
jgi:ankyrin repeat protein